MKLFSCETFHFRFFHQPSCPDHLSRPYWFAHANDSEAPVHDTEDANAPPAQETEAASHTDAPHCSVRLVAREAPLRKNALFRSNQKINRKQNTYFVGHTSISTKSLKSYHEFTQSLLMPGGVWGPKSLALFNTSSTNKDIAIYLKPFPQHRKFSLCFFE